MTSGPSTAAPILAVLAVVLVRLGVMEKRHVSRS
jgi:hypothetical protein